LIYRFDQYELDDELFELRAGDEICSLPRKSFDLLRYLLHHADRVVTKDELFAEIWAGEHVTESVLPVNVRTIRKVLGEERSERILKTVRGRGYRILCRVERFERTTAASMGLAARAGFVGRDTLMQQLRSDYQTSVAGEGRIVMLFGEAGIGKSRTLEEFTSWCRGEGGLVLSVRCPDDPGAPPFWPVIRIMRDGYEALSSSDIQRNLQRDGFDLQRARDSVVEFLQESTLQRSDPAAARFRLTQAIVRMVERLARATPLCIVLDDLHCMDEGTARVCEAIARVVPQNRVMALCAYRDSELRRGSILAQVMGSISGQEGLRQFRLRGLDREGVEAFVRAETGDERSGVLVDSLLERTEGNPFFLRETLRLLVDAGLIDVSSEHEIARLGLAQGIRETIGRRLDTLSTDCNAVLTWASVIGRRFSFPVLEQVAGVDSTRLLELLAEAEEGQIISSAPDSDDEARLPLGEFAFAHGLIRDTIYEDLSGPERVLRHRAVAEAIEGLYGGTASERIFELARHYFEAAPGGDINRAVDYSVRAARKAVLRYAFEDAVRHFDHALRAEELRVPCDDLRYCCVVLARADGLWRSGAYSLAQPEFLRAAGLARELGRYDLLAHAALGIVGWPRFNRIAFVGQEPELDRAEACALVEEALAGLGDTNAALRARLLSVLVRLTSERSRRRLNAMADEAVRLARESCDERSLFHGLLSKLSVLHIAADLDEALQVSSEAVRLAREQRGPTRLFAAYEARIPVLLTLGDMRQADLDIEAASEIGERMRSPAYRYSMVRFRLARALGDGNMAAVAALTVQVAKLGRRVGDVGAEWGSYLIRFWILATQSTAEALKAALDETDSSLLLGPGAQAIMAYFYMLAGDSSQCRSYFERVALDDFRVLEPDSSWLWHVTSCADVAVYLDDRRRARVLYDLLSPYADVNVVSRLYTYRGSVSQPLARLAALLGYREKALELLESALAFHRRIGAEPCVVWTQAIYASILGTGTKEERARAESLWKSVERAGIESGLGGMIGKFRTWTLAATEAERKRNQF